MTESANTSEFLLGLEEYLRYIDQASEADRLHSVARGLQSKDPKLELTRLHLRLLSATLPPEMRELADLCHNINKSNSNEMVYRTVLNYCARVLKNQGQEQLAQETATMLKSLSQPDFAQSIVNTQLAKLDQLFPSDKMFRGIMTYLKLQLDSLPLQDAFSRSQIKSKIWLVQELARVDTNHDHVLIMAGWFGQLVNIYATRLNYAKIRVLELDRSACETSDHVFNLDNLTEHKIKAVCADINQLTMYKNGYEWPVENFRSGTTYKEKFMPTLIVNTSAEHMTEEWYQQLRNKQLDSDPIVAIQSNNLFDIAEHVNCVHSVDHMMKKFPMRKVLFAGELQLKGYKRVMLIGKV
jgi:hypothetical protein